MFNAVIGLVGENHPVVQVIKTQIKIQDAEAAKKLKEELNKELINENRKWGQALLNRKDDGTTVEHIFDRFFVNMQSGIIMEIDKILGSFE